LSSLRPGEDVGFVVSVAWSFNARNFWRAVVPMGDFNERFKWNDVSVAAAAKG
jgi:hypothetical protein